MNKEALERIRRLIRETKRLMDEHEHVESPMSKRVCYFLHYNWLELNQLEYDCLNAHRFPLLKRIINWFSFKKDNHE